MYYNAYKKLLSAKIPCITMLFIVSAHLTAAKYPLIDDLQISKNEIIVSVHHEFARKFLTKNRFVITYEDPEIDLTRLNYSIVTTPIVLCLIPMIWLSKKTFTITMMDKELYHSLQKVKKVFQIFYPTIEWSGKLIPKVLIKNKRAKKLPKKHVGLLFSGGVDSTSSSLGHLDEKQLLITIHGCDIDYGDEKKWQKIKKHCNNFADTYRHATTFIKFNLREIFKYRKLNNIRKDIPRWWSMIMGSLSHAGLAYPLLYQKGYSTLYFASSNTVECPRPFGNHPCIDHNLYCAGIKIIHDQTELNRQQKINLIASTAEKRNLPLPLLRVCWSKDTNMNCNRCLNKCLMTINGILTEGHDPATMGFVTSLEKLKKKMKAFVYSPMSYLSRGSLYDWECIQKRIRDMLQHNRYDDLLDPDLIEYLSWFASIDLEVLCYESRKSFEEKKEYFAYLWNLAIERNMSSFLADYSQKSPHKNHWHAFI